MKFYRFREKIATRKDRMDPTWNTKLRYEPKELIKKNRTIDFDQDLDRKPNLPHS